MTPTRALALAAAVVLLAVAAGDDGPPKAEPRYDPTKPPGQVPWPAAFVRYAGTVSAEMKALARAALAKPLGTVVPGGVIAESGKSWGVVLEWHYHPPGQGFAAEGWHKGATVIVQA